jgi:hypothetical protein
MGLTVMNRFAAGLVLALACLVAVGAERAARGPTTRPTTGPGSVGELAGRATVVSVKGTVQSRPSSTSPWQMTRTGDELDQNAEVRLGVRSAVLIHFAQSDQTMLIDRLGISKVHEAFRLTKPPYGRTRYDISEAEGEHRSELISPSSTLAIRGEKVSITVDRRRAASKTATAPSSRPAAGPTSSAPSTTNPSNSPND